MNTNRTCPVCGEPIVGRVDKKFCSDQCRAEFHNQLNKDSINLMRRVNSSLRKNRRILASLNPGTSKKVARDELEELGFDFRYVTSINQTNTGNTCYFCYEHGYLRDEEDFLTLIKESLNRHSF